MSWKVAVVPLAALLAAGPAASAPEPGVQAILDHAPASAWREVPADDLMVLTLADGGSIAVQLAPLFAPVHVANIKALVRAGRFDGGAIVRVQDNYVVQWAAADDKRALPAGVVAKPPPEYDTGQPGRFSPLPYRDAYAVATGHIQTWPVAVGEGKAWLVHCYGMVGVGRDMPPDTGAGTELYAVIGHAPRHLDRNIALVGRVLDGMERLAAEPRGGAEMGFYRTPAERVPIRSVQMASDLPQDRRPAFVVLDSDSVTFGAWVEARANRRDAFFVRPANGVDICNVQAPAIKRH